MACGGSSRRAAANLSQYGRGSPLCWIEVLPGRALPRHNLPGLSAHAYGPVYGAGKRAEELARAPKPVTIHCKDLNRYFQVYREGNDLFQSEYELDAQGKTVYKDTRRLEDVVGGGINGYT